MAGYGCAVSTAKRFVLSARALYARFVPFFANAEKSIAFLNGFSNFF